MMDRGNRAQQSGIYTNDAAYKVSLSMGGGGRSYQVKGGALVIQVISDSAFPPPQRQERPWLAGKSQAPRG